ncbi:hypothetical protein K438DRAFT_1982253 [Mycena galopus ATCC 62051]|nr:hypothetical protein K438DRAFT_1982253 [Mycena galopus ATCC 62051]
MSDRPGSQCAAGRDDEGFDIRGTYTPTLLEGDFKAYWASDNGLARKRLKEHSKYSRHLKARANQKIQARQQASSAPALNHIGPPDELNNGPTSHRNSLGGCSGPINNPSNFSEGPRIEVVADTETDPANSPDSQEFLRHGWLDASGQRVFFSSGDLTANNDPLAESLARALRGAHAEETLGENIYAHDLEEEDPLFCLGTDEPLMTAETLNNNLFGPNAKSEWFPYPDKAAFLTDVLFSSPRLRFSRAQQKAVLSWAKDLGASVPSYHKFRQIQDSLLATVGDPTKRQQSGRGNVWYLNQISDSIQKDMSNPFTRSGMTLYPEDAGNKLQEVWHGDKMLREIPDHLLSPTIRHNGSIYYVDELVQCKDGSWFLPKRWLTKNGGTSMFASGFHVTELHDRSLVVQEGCREIVDVASFEFNFLQILDQTSGIYPLAAASDKFAEAMPHPLREIASSRMVYSIPIVIFIDDVSGNKSKQWNKHFSCYMSNGALPRNKLENEFHVRFVATSPFASPLEIMQGVRASIEETFSEPVPAWDCEAKEEVLLRSYGLLFAGDNPMQAELCSCAGLNSNYFCRTCNAGGTREWKQSNEGFADILQAGKARDPAETAEETFQQILTALEPNVATTLTEAVRASGTKDALAQPIIDVLVKMGQDLRKVNPNGASYSPDEVQTILTEELKKHQQQGDGITNPLFDMDGIDMHKDTPTEILHTILLGVVKYYWGQTVWLLEKSKDFTLFQTRLNSILSDGLNVPKIQADYMCQYKGGLIGKHFKTLSQVMAFAVEGLVPPDVLEAWLILGRLTVLLWHTEISNVASYTAELEVCINDFINITCKCSPSILISKPKFHFLLHLPFFIRRFGPAVLFSTERYEAYNAVFRLCSIYSNRMTPSRDIAWSFAGIDRVKHIVTGGWWKDSRDQTWMCASPRVLRHILEHPEMAAMVGLPTKAEYEPGTIIPYPKREDGKETPERKLLWGESYAGLAKSSRFPTSTVKFVRTAKALISTSGDKVGIGQNVIIHHEGGKYSPLSFGTIREILLPISSETQPASNTVRVTVELFKLDPVLHPLLHMPVLVRTNLSVVVLPEDIECAINLQHNCHAGQCGPHDAVSIVQERETTTVTRARIRHTDDNCSILNTTSLHNYRQIASAIPASIPAHPFTVDNQAALRTSAAVQIREKNSGDSDDPMSVMPTLIESEPDENPRGRKAELLSRLRPPHRTTAVSLAEIRAAFDAVQELAALAPAKRVALWKMPQE